MDDVLYKLGELHQGQKDIEKALTEGFERVEDALDRHIGDDRSTFEKHSTRLTKLEHANVRIGVVVAIVTFVVSIVATAAARAYFGS